MMVAAGLVWSFLCQFLLHEQVSSKAVCPHGRYFNIEVGACVSCGRCDVYSITRRPCTHTSNTECVTCAGDVRMLQSTECRACHPCPEGEYVADTCSRRHPTICGKCPPGSFNPKTSYSTICMPCTTCDSHHKQQVSPCTSHRNAVCGQCKKGYYAESGSSRCVRCQACIGVGQPTIDKCRQDGMRRRVCGRELQYLFHPKSIQPSRYNGGKGIQGLPRLMSDQDYRLLMALGTTPDHDLVAADRNRTAPHEGGSAQGVNTRDLLLILLPVTSVCVVAVTVTACVMHPYHSNRRNGHRGIPTEESVSRGGVYAQGVTSGLVSAKPSESYKALLSYCSPKDVISYAFQHPLSAGLEEGRASIL